MSRVLSLAFPFFFNDTATTEIYTLSLHDALPISALAHQGGRGGETRRGAGDPRALRAIGQSAWRVGDEVDRKSTRLNSSHSQISYAVFCLKKKKKTTHMLYLRSLEQRA